ncbi:hypothetical protein QBC46DRAFT_422792 [Diplogelasinospora grovesii]|uniref:Uncharacterized protein n=1 Tax=Diplogelasinospora grovesii TaxID=303347 RepID=A0AAN6MYD2_9PEZI|nr:hypothetical protein QBC46DRAFT_422792 [Diplogelasinospora grovesii]
MTLNPILIGDGLTPYLQKWSGRDLSSNWGRLDPTILADQKFDNWVAWTDSAWTTAGDRNGNTQRPALYPSAMPDPDGMTMTRSSLSRYLRTSLTTALSRRHHGRGRRTVLRGALELSSRLEDGGASVIVPYTNQG